MPTDFETAISRAVSLSANVLSVYRGVEVPRQTIDLARALRVLATESWAKADELANRVDTLEAEVIAAKGVARVAEKRTDEIGKRLVEMKADRRGDVKSDG